ncbi:hypothetical protein BDP27DRAFT_1365804 [Rhodocollybia butyracea]|uniref:Uncharacterized protein n=1 Tax=Rhodocollybia butyracea TaxID=206335 RepID=A0A9P5U5Z0_9AGAR|nr:hypothetical protein BDP27DRAFT_1365804 [Rhodocollybia butyracea]
MDIHCLGAGAGWAGQTKVKGLDIRMICVQFHHTGEVLLCPCHALKVIPVHKPFRIFFEENAMVRERNLYIDALKGLATFLHTAKLWESNLDHGDAVQWEGRFTKTESGESNGQWVLSVSIAIVSATGELVKIVAANFIGSNRGELVKIVAANFIGSNRCEEDTKESLASLRCMFHLYEGGEWQVGFSW